MGFWLTGNAAMQAGEFEKIETDVVRSLLDQVDVLINVGANIGYYCCIALRAHKQVVAFEPMPNNLSVLMRNAELNGWENEIEIFPIALGSVPGIIKIFGGGTGASLVEGWAGQPSDDFITVPISTLDLVLGERFAGKRCLVLIDIEGAELHMLKGALKFLEHDPKPIWMVEITVSEHQPAGVQINPNLFETFELFQTAGYRATTANEERREIELDEIARIVETGVDTLGTHNFLFS